MDPRVAFYLFDENGIAVHWYGIIIATALIVAVVLGVMEAKRRGYRSEYVLDFMLIAIPLGIIFARLYYVVFEWQHYGGDFLRIIAVWEGGLAIYGAVIGGALAAFIFAKWRKLSFGEVLDVAAPSIILAQGIGRWGNFVNQEAHGGLITDAAWQWFPAGVEIGGQWYLAAFFYEFVWNLIVFAILIMLRKKIKLRGGVFALYGALYGFGRFWIESLRTDSLWLGDFRISQIVSLALIVLGVLYLVLMPRWQKERPAYDGYYSLSWTPEQLEAYKAEQQAKRKPKKQDVVMPDSDIESDEGGDKTAEAKDKAEKES